MDRPELLKDKPLTQEERVLLNKIAKELAVRWMQKKDIQDLFNIHERKARDCVSTIAKKVPVISLSSGKGYKRCMGLQDLDLALQSRNELDSRIRELTERRNRLNEFINAVAINERL